MSGLAAIIGAVSGYASATSAKQQSEYKDARLESIMSGGKIPMPEAPKSLGSQLVGKVKDAFSATGNDGNSKEPSATKAVTSTPAEKPAATPAATPVTMPAIQPVAAASTPEIKPDNTDFKEAFADDSIVSSDPVAYQNIYGRGRV